MLRPALPESWKTIAGWPAYEVSDRGRVRRGMKILKAVPVQSGKHPSYAPLRVTLSAGINKVKSFRVALLVLEAFVGPRPKDAVIRHLDDDQNNNWRRNLRWGTPKQNAEDRTKNGKSYRGENNGNSCLTIEKVLAIRAEYYYRSRGKHNLDALAEKYKASRSTVHNVIKRKTWKHV